MLSDPTQDPGLRTQDHAAPPAPSFPSGQSPVASCQLPLSDRDRELLRLLRDPAGIDTIDPAEYATWIERPEIQKAIAAQDDLDDRRQRHRDAAHRAECLADNHLARQRLRAVLEATMDLADEAQRTDHRRAATALGRLSDLRPTRRAAHSAQRPRSSAPSSGQSPIASRQPPLSPPHPLTSQSRRGDPSPPQAREQPSHTFPGLDTTVAAFLAALGNPEGLHHATPFVANHRVIEIGPHNLLQWLEGQIAPLRGTELRPGRTVHHEQYDSAEQFLHAVHEDGALSTWIIECVLEREPDRTPARWAIARVNPDTS